VHAAGALRPPGRLTRDRQGSPFYLTLNAIQAVLADVRAAVRPTDAIKRYEPLLAGLWIQLNAPPALVVTDTVVTRTLAPGLLEPDGELDLAAGEADGRQLAARLDCPGQDESGTQAGTSLPPYAAGLRVSWRG